jgi:hypothetical protein
MKLTQTEKQKVLACVRYFEKHFEAEKYKYEKQAMLMPDKDDKLEADIIKLEELTAFYRSLVFKLDKCLSQENVITTDTSWAISDKWVEHQTINIKNIVKFGNDKEDVITATVVANNPYKAMEIAKDWLLSGKAFTVKEVVAQQQLNEIRPTPCGHVLIPRS